MKDKKFHNLFVVCKLETQGSKWCSSGLLWRLEDKKVDGLNSQAEHRDWSPSLNNSQVESEFSLPLPFALFCLLMGWMMPIHNGEGGLCSVYTDSNVSLFQNTFLDTLRIMYSTKYLEDLVTVKLMLD